MDFIFLGRGSQGQSRLPQGGRREKGEGLAEANATIEKSKKLKSHHRIPEKEAAELKEARRLMREECKWGAQAGGLEPPVRRGSGGSAVARVLTSPAPSEMGPAGIRKEGREASGPCPVHCSVKLRLNI